jgi:hypothetical protein
VATEVVVAWVGAAASIGAAGFGTWAAARASQRADGIDRRRHNVEALDTQLESFHAAHAAFLDAVGTAGQGVDELHRLGGVGRMLTRLEVLATHPLATDEVTTAAEGVSQVLTNGIAGGDRTGGDAFQTHLNELRVAVRAVNLATAAERSRLLHDQATHQR